ncbi:RNA polymerase sigma factor [Alteromonas oceanisediminis]|uniref:RNA polymerase sigma factor n=1 Tax=Alteromonas oceanisediminis TaxID=2836180 RepID=UPI001BDAB510|nr:sigma-70 family RNA polymerase sigma factor [Alteromonas oceanisediminis]MBT0586940.1 sigma-70 family RNA polymerase sigma factor [Alteromonas oceanisediminis]
MPSLNDTVSTLYNRDATKLIATLLRVLGPANMNVAEDLVHETFNRALIHWTKKGLPTSPSAWLMLTAKRAAIDYLRQSSNQRRLLQGCLIDDGSEELARSHALNAAFSPSMLEDDQLRLLFWISSSELPDAQRLPLALKALCGMSVDAIGRALLCRPETIKKRLSRATHRLRSVRFDIPAESDLGNALERVHRTLYLLFNEGISAHNPKPNGRADLCLSALGFMRLIIAEPRFRNAESMALTALMHFHYARLPSRFDHAGMPLTLGEQNRAAWLPEHLSSGFALLQLALNDADGQPSCYLLEALIAFEHCRAATFSHTHWQTISQHYLALLKLSPTALNTLSAAVALVEVGNAEHALQLLNSESVSQDNASVAQRFATKAYVHWKMGQPQPAHSNAMKAKQAGLAEVDFRTLMRQISPQSVHF